MSARTRRWEPVVWTDTATRGIGAASQFANDCDRDAHVAALAVTLDVPPVVARLLCQRGIDTPEAAARFLAPSIAHLHDPFLLTDLAPAVERLLAAVARKERIAIHGDYDVDGVRKRAAASGVSMFRWHSSRATTGGTSSVFASAAT